MGRSQIELIDGPLAETCHEIAPSFLRNPPLFIAFANEEETLQHWYQIHGYKAFYLRTTSTIELPEPSRLWKLWPLLAYTLKALAFIWFARLSLKLYFGY